MAAVVTRLISTRVVCDRRLVSLSEAPKQLDLLDPVTRFCDESLPASSIHGFLYRERDRLFPDELFTDLFAAIGRRSRTRCWWTCPPSGILTSAGRDHRR